MENSKKEDMKNSEKKEAVHKKEVNNHKEVADNQKQIIESTRKKVEESLMRRKRINTYIKNKLYEIKRDLKTSQNVAHKEKKIIDISKKIVDISKKIENNIEISVENYMFLYGRLKNEKDKKIILSLLIMDTGIKINDAERMFEKINFKNLKGRKNIIDINNFLFQSKDWYEVVKNIYDIYGPISFISYMELIKWGKLKEISQLKIEKKKVLLKNELEKSNNFRENIIHIILLDFTKVGLITSIKPFIPIIYTDNLLFQELKKIMPGLTKNIDNNEKDTKVLKKEKERLEKETEQIKKEVGKLFEQIKGINSGRILRNISILRTEMSMNTIITTFFPVVTGVNANGLFDIIGAVNRKQLRTSYNEIIQFNEENYKNSPKKEVARIINLIKKKNQ